MERGQKSECESLAVAIRAELGLDTLARLDPRLLAAHFEIEVHPVSALKGDGAVQAAVRHVRQENPKMFSAMTIFPDWPQRRRAIIFNDANSEARQNSDITHELGHGLRLHEPRHATSTAAATTARPRKTRQAGSPAAFSFHELPPWPWHTQGSRLIWPQRGTG